MTGRAKILVVDDEADVLNLVKIMLETGGYEVLTASNGQEALSKINEVKPKLIILDVILPEMDGCEICKKLKDSPETAAIPIIMFSASGSEHTLSRVREAGANEFILKPFTFEQLLDAVKKYLV